MGKKPKVDKYLSSVTIIDKFIDVERSFNSTVDKERFPILVIGRPFEKGLEINTSSLEEFYDFVSYDTPPSLPAFSLDLSRMYSDMADYEYIEELLVGVLSYFCLNVNGQWKSIIFENAELYDEKIMDVISLFLRSDIREYANINFLDTFERIQKENFIPKYEKLYKHLDIVCLYGAKGLDEPTKLKPYLKDEIYEEMMKTQPASKVEDLSDDIRRYTKWKW